MDNTIWSLVKRMRVKTYTELMQIDDFIERYRYLRIGGNIGEDTFGFDRWLNQKFYRTEEWKQLRNHIIARDDGCDMAHPDHNIFNRLVIHHMNPITARDIVDRSKFLLDPEFLVCVSDPTHRAIHYGEESLLPIPLAERRRNDTSPWL